MPAAQRDFPYIRATWLPRLLTDENSCEWAIWFKAHYQDWTRTPSEFNQAEWMLNHTALLNKRKANWKHGGFDVNIERQNSFELRGRSATLAGTRPHHSARRPSGHRRREERAGERQSRCPGDDLPVRHPESAERYRTLKLRGQATYLDHTVRIPTEAVDDQFIQNLGALIRRLASKTPATRMPSTQECRFCDISAADCPERVDRDVEPREGTTSDF